MARGLKEAGHVIGGPRLGSKDLEAVAIKHKSGFQHTYGLVHCNGNFEIFEFLWKQPECVDRQFVLITTPARSRDNVGCAQQKSPGR